MTVTFSPEASTLRRPHLSGQIEMKCSIAPKKNLKGDKKKEPGF